MSTCRACGRVVRVTTLALVSTPEGWATGRVCQKCERRGLLVVAPMSVSAPAPAAAPPESKFVAAKRAILRLRKVLAATGAHDLKIEGVDAAIALLDPEAR